MLYSRNPVQEPVTLRTLNPGDVFSWRPEESMERLYIVMCEISIPDTHKNTDLHSDKLMSVCAIIDGEYDELNPDEKVFHYKNAMLKLEG